MNKLLKKLYILVFLIVITLVIIFFIFSKIHEIEVTHNDLKEDDVTISNEEKDESANLLIPDAAKRAKELNERIREDLKARHEWETNNPEEHKAAQTFHLSKLMELSKLQLQDIELHGLVIDQHGSPLTDLQIEYSGTDAVFASGSGKSSIKTDSNGQFFIGNVKGQYLYIKKPSRLGFHFPEDIYLGDNRKSIWSKYTKDSPYIINAWKVDKYPKITQGDEFLRL